MDETTKSTAIAIWYNALSTDIGLIVTVDDIWKGRQILYDVRKELGDTALENFQIRLSPNDPLHELWIIKKEQRIKVPTVKANLSALE